MCVVCASVRACVRLLWECPLATALSEEQQRAACHLSCMSKLWLVSYVLHMLLKIGTTPGNVSAITWGCLRRSLVALNLKACLPIS